MRQTIKEIEVNVAYRWFLGLELNEPVPHFSTFGKNYTRRFKDTDLFEKIFQRILEDCYRFKLVDPTAVFVDATHVKARANNKKMRKRIAQEEALFYEKLLKKEINEDRRDRRTDEYAPMMPVAPGNRMYTAFLVRLMFVFPAICPREVETRLFYKDKLEFISLK